MKKLCFLFVFSLFAMGSVFAQGGRQPQTSGDFTRDPGGELRSLLPEGVTAFVNNTRKLIQQKNITVAGSKEKGYLAFFAATGCCARRGIMGDEWNSGRDEDCERYHSRADKF